MIKTIKKKYWIIMAAVGVFAAGVYFDWYNYKSWEDIASNIPRFLASLLLHFI